MTDLRYNGLEKKSASEAESEGLAKALTGAHRHGSVRRIQAMAMAEEVSPLLIITAWRANAKSACHTSIIATNGRSANNIRRHRQLFAASQEKAFPASLRYLFVLILRPTKKSAQLFPRRYFWLMKSLRAL